MIYFDTCALLKLVRADAQSGALGAFIDARPPARWFTSELARTELARAVRRVNHDARGRLTDQARLRAELSHVERLWDRLDLIAVGTRVLTERRPARSASRSCRPGNVRKGRARANATASSATANAATSGQPPRE